MENENTKDDSNEKIVNEAELPETTADPLALAENKLAEINDKYLRLYSEYDNYRKRTAKEKLEYMLTAGEEVYRLILPLLDDFERAIKFNEGVEDTVALKDGFKLIYNKMTNSVNQKGLNTINPIGEVFNADLHEAITNIPAPSVELKGKIIDVVEKGYSLNGKVIRFAKVVVGN